jgi:dTDP-4-dehydrorhamnose reductase
MSKTPHSLTHAGKPPLRIILLGANGLLGSSLMRHLSGDPQFAVQRLDRNQLNLGDPLLVDETLSGLEFDWLINGAAYTAVDDCEVQGGHAYLINGHAPGQLARLCAAKGARMIHFSTDYVFDGRQADPYTEDDATNPISVYGRSKLIGERQVLAAHRDHIVIRLSWLFGPGRPNFPEWVLRQAASGSIRVVTDKVGCPTFTEDVAGWVRALLLRPRSGGGIIHVCNPPACTWFEYASEILRLAKMPVQPEPIVMADLPGLQAVRPDNSVLDVTLFEKLSGQKCRPWREAIAEYIASKAAGNRAVLPQPSRALVADATVGAAPSSVESR